MVDLFHVFYNVITPIFLIAVLGFVADRRFHIQTRSLSQILIYFASPALIFTGISTSSLDTTELGQISLFTLVSMISVALASYLLAAILGLTRKVSSAFTLSTTLVNAGNFGLPLIAFAFGNDGISRAAIIFTVTALVSNTLGIFLASRGQASIRDSVLNIFKVPLIYAVVLGLLVNQKVFAPPEPLAKGVALLGQAAVPMMLMVLGIQLSKTRLAGQFRLVALASGVRLVGAPLLGLVLAKLLLLSNLNAQVAIIQTSMPTAVTSIILAEEFGSDATFVSSVVMISTLLSLISLSILLTLLT